MLIEEIGVETAKITHEFECKTFLRLDIKD